MIEENKLPEQSSPAEVELMTKLFQLARSSTTFSTCRFTLSVNSSIGDITVTNSKG